MIWRVTCTAVVLVAGLSDASASENLNFRCTIGDQVAVVETIPEEGRVRYEAPDATFYMDALPNGVYGNDDESAAFEFKADGAVLWLGDVSFACISVNAAASVQGQAETLNYVGKSLGGKLRDGPGTNFRQVGSVAEGTWLTIIANTGINFDGYDWFEVALDNGQRGYQWGGIMCSNGPRLRGIYSSCNAQ